MVDLSRLSGEELLTMRILNGDAVREEISSELDYRARTGTVGPPCRRRKRINVLATRPVRGAA